MDQFMEAALEEARTGAAEGGIPIGAALVDGEDRLVAPALTVWTVNSGSTLVPGTLGRLT